LLPGNTAIDEPDLICRVFAEKLKDLMNYIKGPESPFGKIIAFTYVVEFQKRGLPHAHLLVILASENELRDADDINKRVWAFIPDKEKYQRLYKAVTTHMIHGPCGIMNPKCICMEEDNKGENKCSKDFPKQLREETAVGNDSYAHYARPKIGQTFTNSKGFVIDNQWVVPYNPHLLLRYDAHINVEVCASVKCVKYLYKYCYKGHDRASMVLSKDGENIDNNEIKKFLDMRYVTPHEAFWRIYELTLDEKSHAVVRLDLHLPDQQNVYWNKNQSMAEKLDNQELNKTTLTEWFELNKQDHEARQYYYHEIPEHYTWNRVGEKGWHKKKGGKLCLGRMYSVSPKQDELFYLRMLLLHIKGAQSWQDLMTCDGILYDTFKESAAARGLLDDNEEWIKYFEEAASFNMPRMLRQLFVTAINHGENVDVKDIWEKFKDSMMEDFINQGIDGERGESLAKEDIQNQLEICGLTLIKYGIDLPIGSTICSQSWDRGKELEQYQSMHDTMNQRQKNIVKHVLKIISKKESGTLQNGCVCIDGPAGSGKTYSYRTLCHLFRGRAIKYKTASWMGIAANLLPDGRTLHRTFALPFNIDEHANSNAKPNSAIGKELINTDIFIIDEISMVPKYALEIIDKKLKELMDNNLPFGGKIVIIGGDFRQLLPIKKHGGRSQLVSLSVRYSNLWAHFAENIFRLKENKRAVQNFIDSENIPDQIDFSDFILKMGNGELPVDDDEYVYIPEKCIAKNDLITEVFGEFIEKGDFEEMSKRVILATTNDKVYDINNNVLERLKEKDHEMKLYFSVDKVDSDEPKGYIEYPDEFLHSLNESGLPPHELRLTEGCPVMLTRNLNPAIGLCNGTRMMVTRMHNNILQCKLTTGEKSGETVFIPTIKLSSSEFPFKLHRKQFPIKPCFSMTISKSQGQTIDFLGLDFSDPVFSHGMAYVAFSRARAWEFIKVFVKPGKGNKIKNIVWKEALLEEEN
jgi:hypothetical protein